MKLAILFSFLLFYATPGFAESEARSRATTQTQSSSDIEKAWDRTQTSPFLRIGAQAGMGTLLYVLGTIVLLRGLSLDGEVLDEPSIGGGLFLIASAPFGIYGVGELLGGKGDLTITGITFALGVAAGFGAAYLTEYDTIAVGTYFALPVMASVLAYQLTQPSGSSVTLAPTFYNKGKVGIQLNMRF